MKSLQQYIFENTYDNCAILADYEVSDFKTNKKAAKFAYINYDNDDKFESEDLSKVLKYAKRHIKDEKLNDQDFVIKQYDKNGNDLGDDLYQSA